MLPYRNFQLPTESRTGIPWFLASGAVNLALLLTLVWLGSHARLPAPTPEPVDRPVRQITMVYLVPGGAEALPDGPVAAGGTGEELVVADAEAGDRPEALPDAPSIVRAERDVVAPPTEVPTTIAADFSRAMPESVGVGVAEAGVGTRRRLGPAFGDGELWEGQQLTEGERAYITLTVAAVDSVVRDRIVAAIRELPPDSFRMAVSSGWLTEIGGKTWGIDQQFVHLGGIKIPTVLLALLPLSLPEGNIFQARENRRYEQIRQEIIYHSQRQADRKQVKQYIKDMRERKDNERRIRRGLVAKGDSTGARRDTIIP